MSVRLLGGFGVEIDGSPVPADAWERRRGADLVKLLALAPGGQLGRDLVVESLWPHLDAEAGVANLHKAATIARKALGDPASIVLRDGHAMLAPESELQTDVERFEADRDPSAYEGELLPDDRYEDWTMKRREDLRGLFLEALRGRFMWEELAAEEPADEEAGRELMRSLAAAGRRPAALQRYRRLRDALAAVGVSPGAKTRELYREISRGPAATAPLGADTPIVGRESELRLARAALERAGRGRGGALLISGEPGSGRTRLAEELLAIAAEEGWTTLRGSGATDASGRAYGAVGEALDRLLAERPDLPAGLSEAIRSELGRICPIAGSGSPRVDGRSDRGRIFSAVAALLTAAARERGALLLLDDLDDAMAGTVEVCGHLVATAAFEPLLVVLVHDGRAGNATFDRVRGGLISRGLARELPLAGLEAGAAAQLVEQVASVPVTLETRNAIVDRAGGVPFFLRELAAAVGPEGTLAPPDRLYEVVQARLGALPGTVRSRLSLLAVLGGEITADELIAVAGCEEREAFAVLDEALAAGILEEDEGAYEFRHALVREALLRGVPAHRRKAAHRDAARHLAGSGAAASLIGRHLLAAGLGVEAAPWLAQAAGEAAAVAAYSDALDLADRALPHARGTRRAELLALRADLLLAVGDPGAPAAYAEAIGEPGARSEVELRVMQARALLLGGEVEAATAVISGLEPKDPADRARLVFVRGMLAWFRGEIGEARRCAEEARPLALEAELPVEIEQSTQLHSAVAHSLGDWPGGLKRDLTLSLRLPELAGSVFDAHHCSAEYELACGPPLPIRDAADALRSEADRAGARRAACFAAVLAGEAELAGGEVGRAEVRLREAAELARATGATASESLARTRLGEAAAATGDREGVRRVLAQATGLARDSSIPHHLLYHAFAARIAAAESLDRLAAELTVGEALLAGAAQCAFCPLPFNTAAAGALADLGELERAAEYLARAEAAAALWPAGSWPAALIAEARSRVRAAEGESEQAIVLLQEAIAGFEAAGRTLSRAQAGKRLTALLA